MVVLVTPTYPYNFEKQNSKIWKWEKNRGAQLMETVQ